MWAELGIVMENGYHVPSRYTGRVHMGRGIGTNLVTCLKPIPSHAPLSWCHSIDRLCHAKRFIGVYNDLITFYLFIIPTLLVPDLHMFSPDLSYPVCC